MQDRNSVAWPPVTFCCSYCASPDATLQIKHVDSDKLHQAGCCCCCNKTRKKVSTTDAERIVVVVVVVVVFEKRRSVVFRAFEFVV